MGDRVIMKIVNKHIQFPEIEYEAPNTTGYIHLAAEIERTLPIKPNSKTKKELIARAWQLRSRLSELEEVVSAHILDAFVIPPGNKPGRKILEKNNPDVHIPAYDLVVQIETTSVETAKALQGNSLFKELFNLLKQAALYFHSFVAKNVKKIGEVDKTRPGVFLYNYFFADDLDVVLPVWEYTGRWFVNKTGLDNSTLLMPVEDEPCEYAVINHCRWDRPIDIIPHLIFRPSLRAYVLGNFTANNIVAIPILYKLA